MSWSRFVMSDMASEVGYDHDLQAMTVTWKKSGKVSIYEGVSEDLADQVSRAPSVGQMINSDIKPFYSHRYR